MSIYQIGEIPNSVKREITFNKNGNPTGFNYFIEEESISLKKKLKIELTSIERKDTKFDELMNEIFILNNNKVNLKINKKIYYLDFGKKKITKFEYKAHAETTEEKNEIIEIESRVKPKSESDKEYLKLLLEEKGIETY
jgi:hypothetical protein